MSFIEKNWLDRPTELNPEVGETVAEWLDRIATYAAANPTLVTPLDAAAMEDVETRLSDYTDDAVAAAAALLAPLASPALTGNPTAPTQTAGNDTTRLATTAFVTAAVAAGGGGGGGSPDTWHAMTLNSDWVQATGTLTSDAQAQSVCAYTKVDRVVHIKGAAVAVNTSYLLGLWLGFVPAGYQPPEVIRFVTSFYDAGFNRMIPVWGYVLTDGSIVLRQSLNPTQLIGRTAGDTFLMDGISFFVDD